MPLKLTKEYGNNWAMMQGDHLVGWCHAESEGDAWRQFAVRFWEALKQVKESVNESIGAFVADDDGGAR